MRWMLALLAVAGCKRSTDDPSGGLCTVRADADAAPAFTWPLLTGKPPPAPPPHSWRWINVWATFCKPCVNELPRLVTWRDRLAKAGVPVDFVFVNADPDPTDVDAFRRDFPDTPPVAQSVALADPETGVPAWFQALGLPGSPTIPIQVLVNPAGKIACVRAGSVEDGDYARAEAFLKNPG